MNFIKNSATKKSFKVFVSNFAVLMFFILPVILSAQAASPPPAGGGGTTNNPSVSATIPNPFKGGNDLMSLITAILDNIIMPIAAVGVTMWIIWSGFQFVLAQGKPADLDKAKSNLLWALIGAGILLGAAGISKVVQTTVGDLIKF